MTLKTRIKHLEDRAVSRRFAVLLIETAEEETTYRERIGDTVRELEAVDVPEWQSDHPGGVVLNISYV